MKTIILLLLLIFFCFSLYSQDTTINKRSDFGAILSAQGYRPLDMNNYNKDYNLLQTNSGTEGGAFYRKYLGRMFDLQIEVLSGEHVLHLEDTIHSFRLKDIYYTLNILPTLKTREDGPLTNNKIQFSVGFGPSLIFLGSRKFAYPQNVSAVHSNLGFADVITFALAADMGIKYNYSTHNSFMIGIRGSTDYFFINQDRKDNLDIKYNNFGLYVGFASKIRKR